jgi:hypothetical protein
MYRVQFIFNRNLELIVFTQVGHRGFRCLVDVGRNQSVTIFSRGANIFGGCPGHVTPPSRKAKHQKEVNTQNKD